MPQNYRNVTTAIYARVYEVNQMADLAWLQQRFDVMSRHIRVDKIYLETHRDMVVAEEKTLAQAREFFAARGIRTSGGITITVNEMNRFQTYCYTNPEHRQMLKDVVQFTARQFDASEAQMMGLANRVVPVAAPTDEERAQLDAYHARVLGVVGPQVEPEVAAWLRDACAPI